VYLNEDDKIIQFIITKWRWDWSKNVLVNWMFWVCVFRTWNCSCRICVS